MLKVETPPEVWSLNFSLENPMVLKDKKELDEYQNCYYEIELKYGNEYRYLKDKIGTLKYGDEAISTASEKELKNTFEIYVSLSREDAGYYKENKAFMEKIYDKILKIDPSYWMGMRNELFYLESGEVPEDTFI